MYIYTERERGGGEKERKRIVIDEEEGTNLLHTYIRTFEENKTD